MTNSLLVLGLIGSVGVAGVASAARTDAPAAAAVEGVQVAQAAAQRALRNAELGYRLNYPANWTEDTPTAPVRTSLTAPAGPNPAQCQVIVHAAEEYVGLTQAQLDWGMQNHPFYVEYVTEGLPTHLTGVEVRDALATRVGNRPARMATVAATDPKTQTQQVMLVFVSRTPGRVWHLTCAAWGADARAADAAFAARRVDFLRLFSTFYWDN